MFVYCPECETANPSDADLCSQCGHRLAAQSSGDEPIQLDWTPPPRSRLSVALAQVKKRPRVSAGLACALIAVVLCISYPSSRENMPENGVDTIPEEAWTDPYDKLHVRRFAILQTVQDGELNDWEKQRDSELKAAGSSLEHFYRLLICAMQLMDRYTNSDGSPISLNDIEARLLNGLGTFDMRVPPSWHLWWKLNGTSQNPSWLCAEDKDNRCTQKLINALHDEWNRYALFFENNGAPGVWIEGIRTISDVTIKWEKAVDEAEEMGKSPMLHILKAERAVAGYQIEMTVYDLPRVDHEEGPSCVLNLQLIYDPTSG